MYMLAFVAAWHVQVSDSVGGIIIDLPDITVYTDNVNPTNGVLEIQLTLTAPELSTNPPMSTFNLDLFATGVGLTLSTPQAATTAPLFTGGVFAGNAITALHVQAFHSIVANIPPANSVPSFTGAGLLRVPFTIAPGNAGTTYLLSLNVGLTEMADANGTPYALTLQGGSIFATIPEASGWKLFAVVALASGGVVKVWRKRRPISV
jgi:hypothetical protein